MSDISHSVERLRKAAVAVYVACETPVAGSLSDLLKWAADEIDRRDTEVRLLKDKERTLLGYAQQLEARMDEANEEQVMRDLKRGGSWTVLVALLMVFAFGVAIGAILAPVLQRLL